MCYKLTSIPRLLSDLWIIRFIGLLSVTDCHL